MMLDMNKQHVVKKYLHCTYRNDRSFAYTADNSFAESEVSRICFPFLVNLGGNKTCAVAALRYGTSKRAPPSGRLQLGRETASLVTVRSRSKTGTRICGMFPCEAAESLSASECAAHVLSAESVKPDTGHVSGTRDGRVSSSGATWNGTKFMST